MELLINSHGALKRDAGEICFLCGNIKPVCGAEDRIPLHSHADLYLPTDDEILSSVARLTGEEKGAQRQSLGQLAAGYRLHLFF